MGMRARAQAMPLLDRLNLVKINVIPECLADPAARHTVTVGTWTLQQGRLQRRYCTQVSSSTFYKTHLQPDQKVTIFKLATVRFAVHADHTLPTDPFPQPCSLCHTGTPLHPQTEMGTY